MIAVIVPTVGRSELLRDLLASIRSSTSAEYRAYFVVEIDDLKTLYALPEGADQDYEVILGKFGSYTAAANAGVAMTRERYLLVANDDVLFRPGWDTAAMAAMTGETRVVGIDQGNGRTDCFFLVDREYLDGEFYHPEYLSQYCDTEFAERARAAGVWAEVAGDLIEHRHWTLGKAQMDANYQKAVAAGDDDAQLYRQRRCLWEA